MSEFKLGPIQEQWLKNLEAYPERQTEACLGFLNPDKTYRACCLGELLLTYHREVAGSVEDLWVKSMEDDMFELSDNGEYFNTLESSYKKLGLRDTNGSFKTLVIGGWDSLAELNDNGFTWSQIAEVVRENPEKVFFKSV